MKRLGGRGGSVYLAQKSLVHCPIIRILTRCLLQSGFYLWAWNLGCVDANSWAVWIFNRKTPGWPSFNPAWNLMSQQLRLQPSGYIRTSYRYTTIVGFETRIWCLVDSWQFALSSNDGPECYTQQPSATTTLLPSNHAATDLHPYSAVWKKFFPMAFTKVL